MTRFITSATVVLALLSSSTAAIGKPHAGTPHARQSLAAANNALVVALNSAVQAQANPQAVDHDQGDDHASDRAIFVVCNHDNPSAQRSAICPQPNSPP
jgi:hypothetical protein